MELKNCTFIMACREFFGMLPGQTLQEFAKEVRELTVDDKKYFIELFKTVGYDGEENVTIIDKDEDDDDEDDDDDEEVVDDDDESDDDDDDDDEDDDEVLDEDEDD